MPTTVLAVAIVLSAAGSAAVQRSESTNVPQAEQYLVVRFHVKPGQEQEFERFFTESLAPAAQQLAQSQEALERDLRAFTILRPTTIAPGEPVTYYVIYRMPGSPAGDRDRGEALRGIVRAAFPAAEAEQRIQRWMSSIDLESLVPQGRQFERLVLGAAGGS